MKCCEETAPVLPVASGASSEEKSAKQRKKGANWSEEETRVFLNLCVELNIIKLMDGKRHRHLEILKLVEDKMQEMGFIKTASQLQIKMKHLKESYYKCKKNNNKSGESRTEFLYYKEMDVLLNTRPKTLAMDEVATAGMDTSAGENSAELNVRILTPQEAETVGQSGIGIENRDLTSGEETNSNSTPSTSGSENRQRRAKSQKGGSTSYASKVNYFSETVIASQTQAMKEMLKEHTTALTTNITQQLRDQREWEMEVMKKEQEHSTKMMQMMMSSFLQGIQMQSTGTPTFHPQATQQFMPFGNFERHPSSQPRRDIPAPRNFDAAVNETEVEPKIINEHNTGK